MQCFLCIMMCTVLTPDRDFISSDSLSYLPSSPNILAAWSLTYLIIGLNMRLHVTSLFIMQSLLRYRKNSQRSFVGGMHTTLHGMFIAVIILSALKHLTLSLTSLVCERNKLKTCTMWVITSLWCVVNWTHSTVTDDLRQHGFLVNNGNAVPLRSGTPFPCVPADF